MLVISLCSLSIILYNRRRLHRLFLFFHHLDCVVCMVSCTPSWLLIFSSTLQSSSSTTSLSSPIWPTCLSTTNGLFITPSSRHSFHTHNDRSFVIVTMVITLALILCPSRKNHNQRIRLVCVLGLSISIFIAMPTQPLGYASIATVILYCLWALKEAIFRPKLVAIN